MNNTIDALNRKALDSSKDATDRAAELLLKLRRNTEVPSAPVNASPNPDGSAA
jgi:hypothetical protein